MKESKKIFIDIYHLPQYNFFRNAIKQLGPVKVDLGCVDRGKLVDVIRHECPEFNLIVYGDYKNNSGLFSLVTKIIIPRIYKLIKLFKKKNYSIIGTASYQANVAAKILGLPNFSVIDDPRKGVIGLIKFATKEAYLPSFSNNYDKVKKFNSLKEWAYLSPKYFTPSIEVLKKYDLKKKDYIFMREVATDTSNYLSQEKNLILKLSKIMPSNINVVLSLENKKQRHSYPNHWVILNEPVSDIHSLMYFSKLVISSGDSMAREGGMLGVPSVYLGNRDMPANKILIDKKILFCKTVEETEEFIRISNSSDNYELFQNEFRLKLEDEWDDVTQLILKLVYKKK